MNVGFSEVVVILFVALVVFGPDKLPELARNLGKFYKTINEWKSQVTSTFEEAINIESSEEKAKDCDDPNDNVDPTTLGDKVDANWKEGRPPSALNSLPKSPQKKSNDEESSLGTPSEITSKTDKNSTSTVDEEVKEK